MNKKGFTLFELLAVIIILGIISSICAAVIGSLGENADDKMLDAKIDMIKEAGKNYGKKNLSSILNSNKKYEGTYKCIIIKAGDLVPNYLNNDTGNDCITTGGTGCITSPLKSDTYLDSYNVILYHKNNRVYASVDESNDPDCK